MAGTGNLDVLRIARQLRKRHSPDVPYGSHMAVHMAVGLLFLGGGRCGNFFLSRVFVGYHHPYWLER